MTVCEKCRRKSRRGERFCSRCGTPLQGVAERKHVSILFADLCGSTQRIAGNDPEQARSRLDPALRLMSEAVLAFGGTVSQIRGDEVLAYFGAPVAQEDHALRACLAALAIHEHAQALVPEDGPGYVFRVGIDSGEVMVGDASAFVVSHYRADGDTLHRAKRLEELAEPGTTLVSAATRRLCDGRIEVRDRGEHWLRGLHEPVTVHELRGDRCAVAPLARRRQLAPMMGRERALAAIAAHARAARQGGLRAVGIRGEAGVGKSRLAVELRDQLARDGFVCCWVTAYSFSKEAPYGCIGELARALLDIPGDLDAAAQRAASHEAIAEAGESLLPHVAPLVDLLGLGDPGDAWLALTPRQRLDKLTGAVHALIQMRLHRGPLLLVIDDFGLMDEQSKRMLDNLLKALEQSAVFICATYREDRHPWIAFPWFSEHPIDPLSEAQMRGMAAAIVGDDPTVREVGEMLVALAGGNPFFLEQLAMSLVDKRQLAGPPGAYRRTCDIASIRPPDSVAALIGARVDGLPPLAKTALQCAAVLLDTVTSARIARMAGRSEAEVCIALRHACAAGLLKTGSDSSERFLFRHSLVHDFVGGMPLAPQKKQLHRAAYDTLRAEGEGADDAVLFQHAKQAEAWPETAESALRAMARAIARSANEAALTLFEEGMEASSQRGVDPVRMQPVVLALRMEVLGAQLPKGRMTDAIANLEAAHAITRELGDLRRESGVALQLAVLLWTQGEYERGLVAAKGAEASARHCAGRSALMAAQQARVMLHHAQGRYREAVAGCRSVLREFAVELSARRLLPRWAVLAVVNVQAFLADSQAALGDFGAAQAACDSAYAELGAGDHAFSRILLDFVQGNVWLLQGRTRDAVAVLDRARMACDTHDVPTMKPPIVARLCMAMARSGQIGAALTRIEDAVATKLERQGGRYNAYYFPASHAAVLFEALRHDDALVQARHAIEEARRYGQRGHEAEITLLAAEIAAHGGQPAVAREFYSQALAISAECGMELMQAQALRGMHESIEAAPTAWLERTGRGRHE